MAPRRMHTCSSDDPRRQELRGDERELKATGLAAPRGCVRHLSVQAYLLNLLSSDWVLSLVTWNVVRWSASPCARGAASVARGAGCSADALARWVSMSVFGGGRQGGSVFGGGGGGGGGSVFGGGGGGGGGSVFGGGGGGGGKGGGKGKGKGKGGGGKGKGKGGGSAFGGSAFGGGGGGSFGGGQAGGSAFGGAAAASGGGLFGAAPAPAAARCGNKRGSAAAAPIPAAATSGSGLFEAAPAPAAATSGQSGTGRPPFKVEMDHDSSTPGGATKSSYHAITMMSAYQVWPTPT